MKRAAASLASLVLAVGAAGAAAAPNTAAAKPKPPAPQPLTPAQKQAAKAFAAAMKRGRVATDKKDYAAAVKAFDDALAARPDDPQALAERGYAHLLAKDLDVAEKDLRTAQKHAATASLEGMIWFNLGLVAQGRHDDTAARTAFRESNRLHPTKAAAAQLAGVTCNATIATTRDPGTPYKSWVDLAAGLAATDIGNPLEPRAKSEQEAKARLCGDDGCADAGPWIVAITDDVGDATYHVVLPVAGHLVAHGSIGQKMAGRCPSEDQLSFADDGPGAPVHVVVVAEPNDMVEVDTTGADVKPCGANADHCSEACFYDDKTDLDYYFDAATGAQLAAVTRPEIPRAGAELKLDEDFAQPVTLTRAADGLTLTGGGCTQHAPLSAK